MATEITIDFKSGQMQGDRVECTERRLGELAGIFHDAKAFQKMPPGQVVYRIEYFKPIKDGTEGGLFWGNTTIEPGKVGDEYFMTKGHFHRVRNRGEYYATIQGVGALLLMEEGSETRAETMRPGSLHYIPANTAHRVANTGEEPLTFLACWPSDAGHDYETIERQGFSARMVERNGKPEICVANLTWEP